jgi:hypothetical protein
MTPNHDDQCLVLTLASIDLTPYGREYDTVLIYNCECGLDCGATLHVRQYQAFFTQHGPVLCGDFPMAVVDYQPSHGDTGSGEVRETISAMCVNDLE